MKLAVAARQHLPIAIAAGALVVGGALASASTADAANHGDQIRNYPLKQIDIAKAGVSGSHGAGSSEVEHNSVAGIDIDANAISGSDDEAQTELVPGTVAWKDLSPAAQAKVESVAGGQADQAEFRVTDDGVLQYSYDGGETWKDAGNVQGPKGDTGPQGPAGPAGVSGFAVPTQTFTAIPEGLDTFGVYCAEGKTAIGGGYATSGGAVVSDDKPWWGTAGSDRVSGDPDQPIGWNVSADLNGGKVTVWAMCATVN